MKTNFVVQARRAIVPGVALVLAMNLTLSACGSNGDSTQADAVAAGAENGVDNGAQASPGKPQPNAALVRTESVQAVAEGSELTISVEPKSGVRILSISFPGEQAVTLLQQETRPEIAGKVPGRHWLDLGIKETAGRTEITALLKLESNGKHFGQIVRIPLQPGVASHAPEPVPVEKVADTDMTYPVKEMPAEQEIIRD